MSYVEILRVDVKKLENIISGRSEICLIMEKKLHEEIHKIISKLSHENLQAGMNRMYKIMEHYLWPSSETVFSKHYQAYDDLKELLMIELTSGQELDELVETAQFSSPFKNLFLSIKKRIRMDIGELSRKSIAEYNLDQFTEVLVIAFRVLNYLDIDDSSRLILKGFDVQIYNDIQSNILMLEFKHQEVSNYAIYKSTVQRIEALKREFEYINYFVMNYLDNQVRSPFKVSQIYFDESSVRKNFIEGEVSFRSSVKIIEKLVGPLYLNKEKYGLRELMQNAIDACVKKKKESLIDTDSEYCPLVNIKYIRGEQQGLCIIDNGVGMNEQTIVDHFLTVGESSKNNEHEGQGYIGKFGIGILSAFLLTDELSFDTISNPSDPQGEQYQYCSDHILIDSLRKENAPIHIEKKEVSKPHKTGTKIKLTIKNNILKEIDQTLIGKLKDLQVLYDKAFDQKRHWTGFDRYKNNIWKSEYKQVEQLDFLFEELTLGDLITCVRDVPSFLQVHENSLNQVLRILETLKRTVDENVLLEEESPVYNNDLKNTLSMLLKAFRELKHLDAISCFTYLNANQWYIHNEVDVRFYCDDEPLECYLNTFLEDFKDIKVGENQLNIKYKWLDDKELQGKVLCNYIQIPSKYEFKHHLAPAFRRLPLFSIIEKGADKLNIDLSRERCELEKKHEELILNTILYDILQELLDRLKLPYELRRLEGGKYYREYLFSSENIEDVSLVYYKKNGDLYYSIKSPEIVNQLAREGFHMYCIIGVEVDQMTLPAAFVEYMLEGCIYEIAPWNRYIHTTWDEIEQNQLKICAKNQVNMYLPYRGQASLADVLPIGTLWNKALLLAANNFPAAHVSVSVVNQLKLNNKSLEIFKEDNFFRSALNRHEDKLLMNNVIYLNYDNNELRNIKLKERLESASGLLNAKDANINMILEFHLNGSDGVDIELLLDGFKQFSFKSNQLHNSLQEALRQMQESQDDRLRQLLQERHLYKMEIGMEAAYD